MLLPPFLKPLFEKSGHGILLTRIRTLDESAVLGHVGGPASVAGRSCVTPGVWYVGEPASAAGRSSVTLGLQAVGGQGSKFLAQNGVGPNESGVLGYVGGPSSVTGCSSITPSIRSKGYAGGPASVEGRLCVTSGRYAVGVHGYT